MKKPRKLPQIAQEVSRKSTITPDIVEYWHALSSNLAFLQILEHCEISFKERFSENAKESIHPHIQNERNGGTKGWNKLKKLLLNCPYEPKEVSVTEFAPPEDEFSDRYTR